MSSKHDPLTPWRIAVTGHRPDKLGGYENFDHFRAIRRHMRLEISRACLKHEVSLISGGALGIDQFWIEVGLHMGLPVTVALPFEGHDKMWSLGVRRKYQKLLDQCHTVLYVCESGYQPFKLQKRNEWMVDHCDMLAAYYNGGTGGTKNCIDYARSKDRKIYITNTNEI